jgi:hypothetical protein
MGRENMKKKTTMAFNKKVFLLGAGEDGTKYWLEEASWDCGWYWGFGYIVTYTRNNDPAHSKDISSHQHADHFMSEYFTEFNGSKPVLKDQTFSEKEGWELSELLEQYYTLQKTAEYFKNGKAHCANTTIPDYEKPELVKEINEVRMPVIFKRIYEILTP